MRLLRTDRLEVVEFQEQNIPAYAILSHTWDREEVSFQDVQQGTARSRHGYGKVAGACAVAIQDGFEFIWIDTCCIDKSSSAELSEAINSMFRWYREAEVCYAFLSDVNAHESPSAVSSSFRKSRWFTRGWTLQELIAPGVMYFYGAGWRLVGSRESLLDVIVKITRISSDYFKTGDLSQFSAAQKMSWAANRNTTRIEDTAYCLLGLFDINMPLLYGEGKRAFLRLQEEILRQSEDDSLFVHRHPDILAPSPLWFSDCCDIWQRQTWPPKSTRPLVVSRLVSISRYQITMTFSLIQIDTDQLEDFGFVPWLDKDRASAKLHLALLNCGSELASSALVLYEGSPGVFVKLRRATPATDGGVEALKARLADRLTISTVSISRTTATVSRPAWEWRARGATSSASLGLETQWRMYSDNRGSPTATMTRINRLSLHGIRADKAAKRQDGYRDKVVIKGPSRSTSGFKLQYVYVANFHDHWLERGDEVHLIADEPGDQGQPCLIFSGEANDSFMITLRPTRASANVDLFTNIPPWEGKRTLEYIEMMENRRKAEKGKSPSSSAILHNLGSGRRVVVKLESRRRSDGWWVFVSVAA